MKADRSWFTDASDEATVELRTEAALARVTDRRAAETRAKILESKKQGKRRAGRPAVLGKMFPISYWSEMVGYQPKTICEWCKSGELHAQWIKGEWRITELAMTDFLEKETQARVRKG